MEEATAEISRARLWRWLHHGVALEENLAEAGVLSREVATRSPLPEVLTLPAYDRL